VIVRFRILFVQNNNKEKLFNVDKDKKFLSEFKIGENLLIIEEAKLINYLSWRLHFITLSSEKIFSKLLHFI